MKLKLATLIFLGLILVFFLARRATLMLPPEQVLRQAQGRTNFLLLGLGGAGHEAADLTDTIIFVSLDPKSQDTVLLSIPRDLWVPSLRAKINTSYYYGGLSLAKTAVAEILGQPVDYAVAVDFAGFIKAVDLVGGLDLIVPQAFDDPRYPIPGKETVLPESARYESLHFDAGRQQMTGEQALKYVRSRNAVGEEGSDFARSRRQQQVLSAFKAKLFSRQTLLNPSRLLELKRTLSASLVHDLSEAEIVALAKLGLGFSAAKLRAGVLDVDSGLLVHPPVSARYDNQWVLVPRYEEQLKTYVTNLIFSSPEQVPDTSVTP